MKKIYLSTTANPDFSAFLDEMGYCCETIGNSPALSGGIKSHPDLFLCKMGSHPDAPVYFGDPKKPKSPYPYDIIYNAVCTGKYFIHRLDMTDPRLLALAMDMGMTCIDVRQGYTKCNAVVLDETGLITSDAGIHRALRRFADIDCLLIEVGHVALDGFQTGFLGGASGRVGDNVLFHGALQNHPDFQRIRQFVENRNLTPVWFKDFPLTDIGSVIEGGPADWRNQK